MCVVHQDVLKQSGHLYVYYANCPADPQLVPPLEDILLTVLVAVLRFLAFQIFPG